ncbi:DMT family transporter [Sphingosinicella sp.]|uniref:DMT family transporter n=1 Tax=Sphingosinicella sp. TaxID=1917971 RepID=UPI0040378E47
MQQGRTSIAVPVVVATAAIAFYSAMDAVMKALTIAIGVYNAMLWRMLVATLIAGLVWLALRSPRPSRAGLRMHLIRGIMSSLMAILFFWGLARVPLAQGVALAFIAPLIALYLAALILGEKIERRAILGSLLGFAGVLVIMLAQAEADLGPEAFRGALSILGSAMFYAWNIVLMRQQALVAKPLEATVFTGLIIAACYLPFAPFWGALPPSDQYGPILLSALFGVAALTLLSWAYGRAEAQYLAPIEYTAFVWAALFGLVLFAEPVRPLTLIGAAMIVAGCYVAAKPKKAPLADAMIEV